MFDFKSFFKTIAHVAATAAAVTVASQLQNGVPITSGTILLPAGGAAFAAILHSVVDQFGSQPPAAK